MTLFEYKRSRYSASPYQQFRHGTLFLRVKEVKIKLSQWARVRAVSANYQVSDNPKKKVRRLMRSAFTVLMIQIDDNSIGTVKHLDNSSRRGVHRYSRPRVTRRNECVRRSISQISATIIRTGRLYLLSRSFVVGSRRK